MNTKLLRQKVLDLAIHGKLLDKAVVEALETTPGYEPASKLLERIRGESLPLATAGNPSSSTPSPRGKAPKTPSAPISEDEIPFEIPENWCWCRLGEISFITKLAGYEYSKNIEPNLCNEGIPLFKGKNVQNSKIIYEFEGFIPETVSDALFRSQINRKCILTPYVGTIGNIGIHSRAGKYHLGSNVGKIEINDYRITFEEYIVHYLKSSIGYKQLTKYMKATAQASISMEALRDTFIPLPPLEEQKLIVEEIERIFALIDTVEQNKTDLETVIKQTKSKILDLAIHGKLVPQDKTDEPASKMLEKLRAEKEEKIAKGQLKRDKNDSYIYKSANGKWLERKADGSEEEIEVPFEIPESWSWNRLGNICSKLIDGDHNPPIGLNTKTDYLMISSRNINHNTVEDFDNVRYLSKEVFDKENERTQLQIGDILFTSVGTLGRSCVYQGGYNLTFQRSVSILTVNQNNYYLKYVFDSSYYQNYINEHSTGTAQMGFYLREMSKSLIPIPPLEEQKRIVTRIENMIQALDKIN